MSWNKTGSYISGVYHDQAYSGRVLDSRVKLGGRVEHWVELDEPVYIGTDRRDRIVVEDERYSHA